jgi:membrane protein YdbS with pleckstrin-like domain
VVDVTDPAYTERRQLSPRMRAVWRAHWIVVTLLLGVPLTVLAALATGTGRTVFASVAVAVGVCGLLGAMWAPAEAWARWSYAVGPDVLDLEHGVVTHRRSSVPYFRVQHIDLRSGPIERALGVTRLVVRTASATSDAELPGIPSDEADRLRSLILARAGRDDAV